jgi:CheY-like chemotaxis protein
MHGGKIEVQSGGVGQGSEFLVRLPLARAACRSAAAALPARGGMATVQWPARRILIVDDARDSAYILSKLLGKMGQQVEVQQDALSALESARAAPPDVVISDIAMPNVDGYELARRLRQEPALEGTVLIALTGYGQDSDRQAAKDAGFDHHLVKPVGLEALEEILASLPAPSQERHHEDTKGTRV